MSSAVTIRPEAAADGSAIAAVTWEAFRDAPHSSQTEHLIVDALRSSGVLAVSLVAETSSAQYGSHESAPGDLVGGPAGEIVGHVAFSPVTTDGQSMGWFGLGPLSVAPAWQRQGIGSQLVRAGLDELRERRAAGCVVLGDPRYYERFGFRRCAGLTLPGLPAEYFLALPLSDPENVRALADGSAPRDVAYHSAFEVRPAGE